MLIKDFIVFMNKTKSEAKVSFTKGEAKAAHPRTTKGCAALAAPR